MLGLGLAPPNFTFVAPSMVTDHFESMKFVIETWSDIRMGKLLGTLFLLTPRALLAGLDGLNENYDYS